MTLRKFKHFVFLAVSVAFLFSFGQLKAGETGNKQKSNKTIKILTIGNSFAENACTYLSEITESVPGCKVEYTKANIGGCNLEKHATLIKECEEDSALKPYRNKYTLLELLKKEKYDFVTIQQVSHLSFKPESFQPYADILIKFIQKHAPGAEIIIHQTWAYAPDCKRLNGFGISRDEMHKRLDENYNTLASRYKIDILPSGDSFFDSYAKNQRIDLWNEKDRFHANMNGCYLSGCVWFGNFFNVSPKKVNFKPEEMSRKTARHLRKIAARNVKRP